MDLSSSADRMGHMDLNRTAKLAIAITLAAAVAAPALALADRMPRRSAPTARPVTLPTLPAGWTVVTASPQDLRPNASTDVVTLITSWHYRPTEEGPASVIPPGGTMIGVTLSRWQAYHARKVNLCETTAKFPQYPLRAAPLTLPRTTTDTLDGQPHVTEFRVLGRYRNSYNFEVRVDIDTRRPLGPAWKAAERIVHELRLPQWPTKKDC
jgi:hypothetical protein